MTVASKYNMQNIMQSTHVTFRGFQASLRRLSSVSRSSHRYDSQILKPPFILLALETTASHGHTCMHTPFLQHEASEGFHAYAGTIALQIAKAKEVFT